MNPEDEYPNIESFPETNFDHTSGRYITDNETINCTMLDASFIFNLENEEDGI